MELNRNPENFFAEVEQSAFNPANVVPGIGFSPDRMLQGGSSLSNGEQADAAYGKGVAAALGIAMTEVVTKSGALAEAA